LRIEAVMRRIMLTFDVVSIKPNLTLDPELDGNSRPNDQGACVSVLPPMGSRRNDGLRNAEHHSPRVGEHPRELSVDQ